MNLLYILGNTDAGDISVYWEEMTGQRLDLSLEEWQALMLAICKPKYTLSNYRSWSWSKSRFRSMFRSLDGSRSLSKDRYRNWFFV